jgi:hypothetical protein
MISNLGLKHRLSGSTPNLAEQFSSGGNDVRQRAKVDVKKNDSENASTVEEPEKKLSIP